jgi:hypothetical protein
MIVDQAVIDQIRGKMRRRVLELPVEYGKLGELKLPVREGGVYTLKPPIPYMRYRGEVERHQPTRARAVLRLIDLCDMPRRTVTITVTHPPERQGDKWLIRFEKGDWRGQSDQPVYLARTNDFTTIASMQTVPGDPEFLTPFAEDLRRAREKAVERRVSPERQAVKRRADDANTLQRSMTNMKARTLVKRAQRNYEAAERLLLADQVLHSPVVAATVGSQGEEDRPPSANTLATPEAA